MALFCGGLGVVFFIERGNAEAATRERTRKNLRKIGQAMHQAEAKRIEEADRMKFPMPPAPE